MAGNNEPRQRRGEPKSSYGTNQVYAIWSTTNLPPVWNVETEVWPTNTSVMPFTVATSDRLNLFMRAEDWTGVTQNGNTTPDWWFWEYFGTIALSDTNFDSTGTNTLLYDYQHTKDPNPISFTVSLGAYCNTTNLSGNYLVLEGEPSAEAVLVNNTNTNTAVWRPYDGTAAINLGPTDGAYQVWLGLKGFALNSQPVWISRTVHLDRVAPTLNLTSPTNSTVSQPMIQIQGYAGKPLSQLTFAVTNAAGGFANQTGYVTNQFFNMTLQAFTTNYFQCYDVMLTNGVNAITIAATDLAGNTTTLTTNYTVDYSNDHTPPVLNIIWPQSGTYISGSSFTLQAMVDDDTANVTATITDSYGNTNTVQALVERSGLAWAQNVPLSAGVNTLTVTATDAAGNVTTSNLTLLQSSVMVTMNALASNQLNQSYVSVSGTVSDPTTQVYVNAIQASVNTNGTWSAANVPASSIGTAIFDVEIYGGSNASLALSAQSQANSSSSGTATGSEQFPTVQPATVGLMSYSGSQSFDYVTSPTGYGYTWADSISWSCNLGGTYVFSDSENPPAPINETLPPTTNGQPPISPPWQYTDVNNITASGQTSSFRGPIIHYQWSWNNETRTRVMVEPTGQSVPGGNVLYYVQACAMEVSDPPHGASPLESGDTPESFGDLFDGGPSWYYGDAPLPPQWLQIQGQTLNNTGMADTNGAYWGAAYVAAPAGVSCDITPEATEAYFYQDYTFNVQAKPGLIISDANTGANLASLTNTAIVGQQMNLNCQLAVPNGQTLSNFQWTVTGTTQSAFYVSGDSLWTNGYPIPLTNTTGSNVTAIRSWRKGPLVSGYNKVICA